MSDLRAANRAAGWSSESLVFAAEVERRVNEYVIRIPPSGGGIFPTYDLGAQTLTQVLLHEHGIATPSPIVYEPDESWIGSKFIVMPRIVGHTPSDTSYATRVAPRRRRRMSNGGPTIRSSRRSRGCSRVPIDDATWLATPDGIGNNAELTWWREYVKWGTDDQVPDADGSGVRLAGEASTRRTGRTGRLLG